MTEKTRKFWTAPSGLLHGMATCSGGPGPKRMLPTTLTAVEWWNHNNKCRCARWTQATNQLTESKV